MSLVQQKASGMSLASSGGDSPKKPPGRSRLPLPADCPDIRPKSNKKGQAPQFIQSYRDLPEWKDRRVKAKFTETPPEHLNEEYTRRKKEQTPQVISKYKDLPDKSKPLDTSDTF